MFKIGDVVTRFSHSNDVVFKIIRIEDNIAYLKGINVRLCADSDISDLIKVEEEKDSDRYFYEKLEKIRTFERSDYFYIPGKILHIDAEIKKSRL